MFVGQTPFLKIPTPVPKLPNPHLFKLFCYNLSPTTSTICYLASFVLQHNRTFSKILATQTNTVNRLEDFPKHRTQHKPTPERKGKTFTTEKIFFLIFQNLAKPAH